MKLSVLKNKKTQISIAATLLILLTTIVFVAAFQKTQPKQVQTSPKKKTISPTISPTKTITPSPTPKISITTTPKPTYGVTITPTKAVATATPIPATNTPAPTATPGPTNTPTPPPDKEPPQTRIFYPKNGGELAYKTNGQVCAISEGPLDNVSNWQKIQTRYKFDGDEWSGYETMRVYLCRDPLPNGAHTLKVQSKDEAGNEEAEQTISFTVNIEGN